MRWSNTLNFTGILIFFLGLTMLIPLGFGIYYHDESIFPIIKSMVITVIAGLLLYKIFKASNTDALHHREGMAIVTLCWVFAGIFGALPFYFSGTSGSFLNALFESVSGFTTTGASILPNIEIVPRGILLWRSLIQWLGGMGIIVLSLALLPLLGIGGMQLYKAEVPTPVPDKLKPHIRDTAKVLWKVYILMSAVEFLLLFIGGMSFFDAICHTFTTMPTGGFSTKNASVAHFNSVYFDIVIIFFMFFAGINFALHYQMLKGKPLAFWKDNEFRIFFGVTLFFCLIVSFNIFGPVYSNFFESLRFGTFNVISIITTTGFATADFEKWPALSQLILVLCMFFGASAGSTGGGIKFLRIILLFKHCLRELFTLLHPHAVTQIKLGTRIVPDNIMRSIWGFLGLYIGLFILCTLIIAGMGVDIITSFTSVASCIGNIGPGLGMVGPTDNFTTIPEAGKLVLIWCMLLGRLEIYTVIILLVPEFWRK